MRWVERLWRDDGRVKATPARVAASLAEGVTQSTNALKARLEEQGLSRAVRERGVHSRVPSVRVVPSRRRRASRVRPAYRHDPACPGQAPRGGPRSKRSLSVGPVGFRAASSRALSRISGRDRGQHLPAGVGGAGLAPHCRHGHIERPDDDVSDDARGRGAASSARSREAVHPRHRAPLALLGTPRGMTRRASRRRRRAE